jgi:hypothetical protein
MVSGRLQQMINSLDVIFGQLAAGQMDSTGSA